MSGQHSVIEHRANYFFLKIEEDYIAIFPEEDTHRHCKAAILSILEHWMNSKRTENEPYPDMYVYLSYPQFAKQMFGLFSRSTIIKCLRDLVIDGLVFSHPYIDSFNQKTFAYMLNIPVINEKLRALPERKVGSVKINGGSVNLNDPHVNLNDGSFKNKLPSSKSKRNIDYIDSNIDSSQIDIEDEEGADAPTLTRNELIEDIVETHADVKHITNTHLKVVKPSDSQCLQEITIGASNANSHTSDHSGKPDRGSAVDQLAPPRNQNRVEATQRHMQGGLDAPQNHPHSVPAVPDPLSSAHGGPAGASATAGRLVTPEQQTPGVSQALPSGGSDPGSATSPPQRGASQASAIPKRPKSKKPVLIELTLQGSQVKAWYEEIRGAKMRVTEKNMQACNSLGDDEQVTHDSLKATIEHLDGLAWVKEHDFAIDIQVLADDKSRLNFEKNWPLVKRKLEQKPPKEDKPKNGEQKLGISGLPIWEGREVKYG